MVDITRIQVRYEGLDPPVTGWVTPDASPVGGPVYLQKESRQWIALRGERVVRAEPRIDSEIVGRVPEGSTVDQLGEEISVEVEAERALMPQHPHLLQWTEGLLTTCEVCGAKGEEQGGLYRCQPCLWDACKNCARPYLRKTKVELTRMKVFAPGVVGWVSPDARPVGGPVYFEPAKGPRFWMAIRDDAVVSAEAKLDSESLGTMVQGQFVA